MLRRWFATAALVFCAVILGTSGDAICAAELCTDAERRWLELRNSDDVKTKLLADRWYGVVRLQEWDDASGKFRTEAKYVEHDPKLEWVKLRVIRGTGHERVVKEVTIPTAKLSKTCQSRVRQISVLTEKMNTAATEEKERVAKKSEGKESTERAAEEPMEGDEMAEEPNARSGRDDGGLAGMDGREVLAGGEQLERTGSEVAAAPQSVAVFNAVPPLPAVLPVLPKVPAAVEPAVEQQASAPSLAARSQLGDEAWRTHYDVFRENIKPQNSRELSGLEWGDLHSLKEAHDTLLRVEATGPVGEAELAEISQKLDAVGEVTWEATLTATSDQQGEWTAALGLPALAEPMELRFILDPERDPGPWQNVKTGDNVRFIGRFYAFDEEYGVTVAIRFVADQPTADIAPAESTRR